MYDLWFGMGTTCGGYGVHGYRYSVGIIWPGRLPFLNPTPESGQPMRPACSLANMSTFNTLKGLLMSIEKTFGDPDRERIAHTQLHALKMMPGMTAEEYTANFEMLAQKDWLQWSSPRGCLHLRTPLILSFWRSTLRHLSHPAWTTGRQSCTTYTASKEGICWTEAVNSSKPSTIPQMNTPATTQTTRCLSTYGYRPEQA